MLFSFSTERFTEKEQRQLFWRRLIRRVFLEDWGTKLMALGISFALWLGVSGLRTAKTVKLDDVSLNLRISNEMEITNTINRKVDIVVTADDRAFENLNDRNLVVSIDLTDVKPGEHIIQLTPDTVNLSLPNGIKLDEIQPNKIAVKLEKVEEKEVLVKVETEGNLAEGTEIYGTSVFPAKVRVRGAESFIKSFDSVSTEKINIEGLKENSFARQVGLNVVNPKITLLDTIVDVSLRIGEKRIEKVFSVIVKTETDAKNVSLTVLGPRSVVEKLKPEDFSVQIIKNDNSEEIIEVNVLDEFQNLIEITKKKLAS